MVPTTHVRLTGSFGNARDVLAFVLKKIRGKTCLVYPWFRVDLCDALGVGGPGAGGGPVGGIGEGVVRPQSNAANGVYRAVMRPRHEELNVKVPTGSAGSGRLRQCLKGILGKGDEQFLVNNC